MSDGGGRYPQALDALRVVECGAGVASALCARLLADFGADVVKVEPPGGDPLRAHGPFPADAPHPERSALFAFLNAGKRSVVLDPERAAAGAELGALAAMADVVVTGRAAEARARWDLDLDALRRTAPAVVTVSLSPLGERGAWGHCRADEITVCALAGASVILGEPGRPPLSFPFHLPALQAGLHGAAAVLAALLVRRRCGRGQHIEIAEADVLAYYTGGMSLYILGGGGKWRRRGLDRHGPIYPSGFYPCADGFIFIATQTRAQWRGFLGLMGDPEWAREDPALQDGVAIGWKRADEVDVHFIPWLTQYTRRELVALAREANLVLGPVSTVEELLEEPHLRAREFWADLALDGTPLRVPGLGPRMSATPWRIGQPPRLGAHTAEIQAAWAAARSAAPPDGPSAPPPRPLEGRRVLEFGWNWAGPMVGQIFADLGAEVVKVETRARLDFMRHWAHARPFFCNANRGKLSVSVNVKHPEGAALVRRLAAETDIVLDNFSAGVMARNGLGYDDLRRLRPDIIVLSMAMAGQFGPLQHLRGFATIATGFAGLEALVGYPDTGPTGFQFLGLGDTNAAIQAVLACLVALWRREHTGEGQFIDLSQVDAAVTLVAEPLCDVQLNRRAVGPQGNRHPWMAPHGTYPTAGRDQWVALAVATDDEWRALGRVMGEPGWAGAEPFATRAGRHDRQAEIDARLAAWTAGFDRDELVARLQEVGLAAAPVLGIEEVRQHPHFRDRWGEPERRAGESPVYGTPWHLGLTPCGTDRPAPEVGEHNQYAFGTLLGMTPAEIERLAEQRVMW